MTADPAPQPSGLINSFSVALAALAAGASGMLAAQHLAGLSLPGCGPTSACAQLSASFWGNIVGWPVSYLGLTYFLALTAGFLFAGSRPIPRSALALIGLGGLTSLGFLGIMAAEQKWCLYCLAAHICNLTLAGLCVISRREPHTSLWWPAWIGTAVVSTIALAMVDAQTMARISGEQRALTEQSIEEILQQLPAEVASSDSPPADGGFTGRYHRGPEQAAVRLVVFHDYQCKDCAKLDAELEELLTEQPRLSVSIRHYPMCSQCNPNIAWEFFHKEACNAAYLAEAAGRLGGEEAFWKTHRWLFEHKGVFTPEELTAFCQTAGLDAGQLRELAAQPAIQQIVKVDIAEAISLGATGTPFVFLNGVEVQGTSSNPENARLAIERVLAENPPARAAAWDRRPPKAHDRLLTEWQRADPVDLPPTEAARYVFGNPEGTNRLLLFLEPTDRDAASLWQNALSVAQSRDDVRLELYLFPIHSQINPAYAGLKTEFYPRSAMISKLVEALRAAESESLPSAISWCLQASSDLSEDNLITHAAEANGIDAEKLRTLYEQPETAAGITSDLSQAEITDVSWAPALIVHGRSAPTAAAGTDLIQRMLDTPADE